MYLKRDFRIETADGWQLAASHYGELNAAPVIIIANAIGVRRQFYNGLAEYFASEGYHVLTFDYRGMGESTSRLHDHNTIRLEDWGELDIKSVIDWAVKEFPNSSKYLIGHSVAGQVFPLAANANKLDAVCFVASQNPAKYYWNGFQKKVVNFFWKFVIPFTTRWFGHLPGWAYGGKYKIPFTVARDWATWGNSRDGVLEKLQNRDRFSRIHMPILFMSFSDDKLLAPKKAVEAIREGYGSRQKEHLHLTPHDLGVDRIGHFNFFSSNMSNHWKALKEWFEGESVQQSKLSRQA